MHQKHGELGCGGQSQSTLCPGLHRCPSGSFLINLPFTCVF
ncbi:hypothetical protein I314_02537 [Cryptococcus bacillisporus CA1873]|uniref:Uncharacterized protein n=2 Tax=Cryptococcus gattii TaxID=552467 RepID=A0A0D0VY98_CRYGA|nr:hypothetical protein I312_00276 [Cryptococcus bacillisporus CA1280]KIR67319.1 hypothetical protein I314_02537 [Cryptococcus bacillisporus CA1873]|eukprot:KIR67319.1 hypothetical protein I314_02537 [Cryptococcus gattii CA1873]